MCKWSDPQHPGDLGRGKDCVSYIQGFLVVANADIWQMVKNMYPGYTGTYPKIQVYHGSADTTLYPSNYNETIKEWAGVFGFDYTKPDTTAASTPQSGYTTYSWGSPVKLQGIYAVGVGHTVPIRGSDDMKFFGL